MSQWARHGGARRDSAGKRIALCLFGKLGAWEVAPTHLGKHGNNRSVATYAMLAHQTIQRHILQANRQDGLDVDVFLHSWNPQVGHILDDLYQPNASLHQEPLQTLERVRSAHLSMKRVLLLLRAHEIPGQEVSLVMISRFDVLWFDDLLLLALSTSHIWLPHHCQPVLGLSDAASKEVYSLCQSDRGALMEPVYAQRSFGVHLQREQNYNSFVLDYWFISSVEVAESFAAIYHQHDGTGTMSQSRLQVGFVSHSEVKFNLARFFAFGNDCLVDTGPVRAALSSQLAQMSAKLTPSPFHGAGPMIGIANTVPVVKSESKELGNVSWLAAQCPHSLKSGRKLQCPWYSRQCTPSDSAHGHHSPKDLINLGTRLRKEAGKVVQK